VIAEVVPPPTLTVDRIRQALSGTSTPTDIRVVSADETRIVMFGPTDDVDAWTRRLDRMIEDHLDGDAAGIRACVVASVPFPEGCEAARDVILSTIDSPRGIIRA
jgi:hypothetical protein